MLADYAEYEQAIGLDWYAIDPNLSLLLDRHLPDTGDRAFAEKVASAFGKLVGEKIAPRADETDKNGPVLRRYDRWGVEIDEVVHSAGWLDNKADLIRAGFVGLPQHAGRQVPAVVTASMSYLVSQAETAVYCGLGMTSGAADIVERYAPARVRPELVRRLTSLDPAEAWEGGMFLTERQGGSDVGANTTRAVQDGDEWRLYGDKHFCSNVDADVFIVLARPEGAPAGSRGLATFIVPRRDPNGLPNGFHIKRLKPKLGTVGVPTGEVSLDGAVAWLAGPERRDGDGATPASADADADTDDEGATGDAARDGRGINRMMEMVNGSRFGVSLMSLGIHRRSFLEAAIYAARREQFGNRIDSYPLVRETLVDLLVDLEAGMALTFECASANRSATSPEEGALFRRIAIPLAKMRSCRIGLQAASTALEVLGGNGYMEDWPMARQLRDAQCHTIWEGTENICCIDVRRAMRSDGAHRVVVTWIARALEEAGSHKVLSKASDGVAAAMGELQQAIRYLDRAPDDMALLNLRRFSELMADTLEGALLLREATWALAYNGDARKAAVARRFVSRRLEQKPMRGIGDSDRTVLDLFEPIVRYGRITPDEVLAAY
ncbi:MAG TPA: acyl-CoA dehydrogenase family protein [Acidimicrobiales bacterium]|nr:acyl-CoA dehydrogenase family protein [Acidimicrobiales bacterium]